MGGSKKTTVGYWYRMLFHYGFCKGPIDAFLELRGGNRIAWQGALTASGRITVSKPDLWGGTKSEGGLDGDFDIMFGESTQVANDYLTAQLGADQPTYRGKATGVWRGGRYGAMNPYPKPLAFKIRRILKGWDGDVCWYSTTAPITMGGTLSIPASSNYKYIVEATPTPDYSSATYDDSAWAVAPGPFSSGAPPGTYVPTGLSGRTIWIRKTIPQSDIATGSGLTLTIAHDDGLWLWFNGAPITVSGAGSVGTSVVTITPDMIAATNVIAVKVVDAQPTGTPTGITASLAIGTSVPFIAMNPAHILYDSLTAQDMQGEPTALINDASFRAAADTLYAEGFGLCTTYEGEGIEQFQQRICDVIGGSLTQSRVDGLYYLDLVRGNYVLADLPIISSDDIIEFGQQMTAPHEVVNQILVDWFDPQAKGDRTTQPLHALGAIQASGGIVSETKTYREIPTEGLALRVGQRDLIAKSTPLARFDLTTNRRPWAIRPGTYFRLQYPEEGIADMVCLLADIDSGTLAEGKLRIKAVQDVFGFPATVYATTEPGKAPPPVTTPTSPPQQFLLEAPYAELAAQLSSADLAVFPADGAGLLAVATRPTAGLNYELYTAGAGESLADHGSGDWCPSALIVNAGSITATGLVMGSGSDLDRVALATWALWDNEIVRVDAINATPNALTLARGCIDTVPAAHLAGSRIYFMSDWASTDGREFVSGEAVTAKLLASTGTVTQALADATLLNLIIAGRQIKPYPPGLLTINTAYFPDTITGALALAWAHRDRVLQADQIIDHLRASIGPEPGVTYTLRLYGQAGTLLRTETGLTGNSYSWAAEVADSGIIGPGDDPYWNNVVALLHCDGTNGGTTFTDQKGHTFTATGNAQISTAQSKFGGASALFDGTGDLVSSADHADWAMGSGDFTIECWVLPASTAAQGIIFQKRASNTVYAPFGIYLDAGGKAGFLISVNGSGWGVQILTGTGIFVAGTWAHVALCRSGNNYYTFVNGASTGTASLAGALYVNTAPLCIGANGDASVSFNGNIDDIRITKGAARYTATFTPPAAAFPNQGGTAINGQVRIQLESVRSAITSWQRHDWTVNRVDPWWADVVALLRMDGTNGSTTFTDQKGHTFTATGNAQISTAQSKFGGASALFDGTGDLVSSADHADWAMGSGDFTIECWVRPAAIGAVQEITSKRLNNANYSPFELYIDAAGKAGFAISTSGSAWAVSVLSSAAVFAVGAWAHVAMCRQDGTIYCWVNGVSAGSASISGAVMTNTQPLCIGANADASVSFNGNIDAFRITKAHARYVAAFTPLNKAFPEG